MIKTKIVATIGPATDKEEALRGLLAKGVDVARLNFSHGSREEHGKKISLIRRLATELNKSIAILQDLAGPKIRIGELPPEGIDLEAGDTFILTSRPVEGTKNRVAVTYSDLPREVKPGDHLLLADGLLELIVEATNTTDITCRVNIGGHLTSHKGINLPTSTLKIPSLTEKDKEDLVFGLKHDVDYVAISFVKTAEDILRAKEFIKHHGKNTPVIAKIEKHEAIENIKAIIDKADGLMVARGDLGVEIPPERVPLIQKKIIAMANQAGIPVITATQMLKSMTASPRPTRAEATDVVNAILDGTDAVMLSEETATGAFPVEAVDFMRRLAQEAELSIPYESLLHRWPTITISEAVAQASCSLASQLSACAIVVHTQTGMTARHIARFRPRQPIIALTPVETTVRLLNLVFGCFPYLTKTPKNTDEMIEQATEAAQKWGGAKKGDLIVITMGHPAGRKGTTNMLRVKKIL